MGLKPSYGTLSRFGLIAYASSLDCPGIFTRNIRDCAYVLDHLSDPDPNDNNTISRFCPQRTNAFDAISHYEPGAPLLSSGKRLRVGIPKEYWVNELSPTMVDFWQKSASALEALGADVVECSLPHSKYALPVYLVIANAEASSNLARYDGVRYGAFCLFVGHSFSFLPLRRTPE